MSESGRGLPRWVWVLGGVALVGWAIYGLKNVLTPIFFAFLIAYFLDPLVDRFEARGVPRAVGIVLLLVITLGGLGLFIGLLVPSVVREVVAFSNELPGRVMGTWATLEPWLAAQGVPVPQSVDELKELLVTHGIGEDGGGDIASRAGVVLAAAGRWVLGGTSSALNVVTTLVVVPVFAFYLLYDFDRMTAGARDLVPWRYRPFVVDVAKEIDLVLGQFMRGQIIVIVVLAVLYSLAYSIVGIRLAIPIGIVAGLLSFIPYVGGIAALVMALAMCALHFQGWGQVAGVLVGYTVIQLLESFVITPRVVGEKVGLPAVWVLVALLVGGELFGFLGVLLAVPAAAVCKIFVLRALAFYRESPLFLEGGRPPEGALGRLLVQEGLPDSTRTAAAKAEAKAPVASVETESARDEVEPASERAVAERPEPPMEGSDAEAASSSHAEAPAPRAPVSAPVDEPVGDEERRPAEAQGAEEREVDEEPPEGDRSEDADEDGGDDSAAARGDLDERADVDDPSQPAEPDADGDDEREEEEVKHE